jgi:MFS family permease
VVDVEFIPGERARPEWLRRHPRGWLAAVAAVCVGAFLGQLDASIVALAYGAIGDRFDAPLGTVQWVSLAYLITLAGLLVPLGLGSDRLGRKRVYLWGFAVFGLSSLAASLATSLLMLVLFRVVQGTGAAMLQANGVALITTSAPRDRLRAALGAQAAAQALGLTLGPAVGGLVVDTIGWRWIFALNVPVAVLAVATGRLLLPRTRVMRTAARRRATAALGAVLRAPGVAPGLVGAFGAYLLLFGPIVLVPAVLAGHGRSTAAVGLMVGALPVGFAIAATGFERLAPSTWSALARARAAQAVVAIGLLAALVAASAPWAWPAALLVIGLGLGAYTPANNAQLMHAAPEGHTALAGGLVSTARALGTALGTALMATAAPAGAAVAISCLLVVCASVSVATEVSGGATSRAERARARTSRS